MPSHNGKLLLYSSSTHTFGGTTVVEILVMNLASGESSVLARDNHAHDAVWIPGTEDVALLKSIESGQTQLIIANGRDTTEGHYVAGEFEAPVTNLKLKALANGTIAFVVTGLAGEDGLLHVETPKKSTARIFDTSAVRVVSPFRSSNLVFF